LLLKTEREVTARLGEADLVAVGCDAVRVILGADADIGGVVTDRAGHQHHGHGLTVETVRRRIPPFVYSEDVVLAHPFASFSASSRYSRSIQRLSSQGGRSP